MTTIGMVPMSTSTARIIAANGARITAIDMVINPTDCDEPCNAVITVTWKNIGDEKGEFKPAIIVSGNRITKPKITLLKNETTTQIFNLTDLMEGTYTVCPDPN